MNVFDFLSTRYRGDRHSLSQPMGFVVRYMGKLVGGLCSGRQNDSQGWRLFNPPGAFSALALLLLVPLLLVLHGQTNLSPFFFCIVASTTTFFGRL